MNSTDQLATEKQIRAWNPQKEFGEGGFP